MNTCPAAHTSSQPPIARAHVPDISYPSVLHGADMRFMHEVAPEVEEFTGPRRSKSLKGLWLNARPCAVVRWA